MAATFVDVVGGPVTREIDGVSLTFPQLTRKQVGELLAKWASAERAKVKRLLAEVNAPPELQFDALRAFDLDSSYPSWLIGRMAQQDRAEEVIQQAGHDASEWRLPRDALVELACEIVGYRLQPTDDESEGDVGPKAE